MFWHLTNLQILGFLAQTELPGLYFIVSSVSKATALFISFNTWLFLVQTPSNTQISDLHFPTFQLIAYWDEIQPEEKCQASNCYCDTALCLCCVNQIRKLTFTLPLCSVYGLNCHFLDIFKNQHVFKSTCTLNWSVFMTVCTLFLSESLILLVWSFFDFVELQ